MSHILTTIAYVAGSAVTIIVTGGIAVPAWLIPALTGVGVVAGHLATSPTDQKTVDSVKLTSSITESPAVPFDATAIAALVASAQAAGQAAQTAEHMKFLATPAGGGKATT